MFPMSENAKQDTLIPYFQCKMEEIYEIAHSDANFFLFFYLRYRGSCPDYPSSTGCPRNSLAVTPEELHMNETSHTFNI